MKNRTESTTERATESAWHQAEHSTLPVRPKLVKRAVDWEWSSAAAHAAGTDMDGLLCLDVWRELFGKPERAAEAWVEYVEAPAEEAAANAARTLAAKLTFAPHNRPVKWAAPEVALRVGEAPS
jgi:hypothetical protein